MATCNDVVRLAMQRMRQLRAGESPTGQEAEDGLLALQALYDQWFADGLFGRLNDTIIAGNYTAQEQDRVINDGGYTVTLPLTIQPSIPNGAYYPYWPDDVLWSSTYTTVPRPPRDMAAVEVVASNATQRSIYDRTLRMWIRLDNLALTDNAPLAARGMLGLASCLAMTWADEFGPTAAPGPSTQAAAASFKWGINARYDSARKAAMQDYF